MAAEEALMSPMTPPASLLMATQRSFEEGDGEETITFGLGEHGPEVIEASQEGEEVQEQVVEDRQVAEEGCADQDLEEPNLPILPISEEIPCESDDRQDQGREAAAEQEMAKINSAIEKLEENSHIPRDVLDSILQGSFPVPCSSSLHLLGTKYSLLLQKFEECSQRMKCLEEYVPKYETLTKKYMEEWAERKKLYNEVIELKGNIRVFCRCRPMNSDEISKGYSSVFEFDPSHDTELQIIASDNSKKQFKFDHVFGPEDSQEDIFAETQPIVKSVLDGFNACIFAYGQTGTGKTFTMEGTLENRGVNFRTLEELFRISEERCSLMKYEFFVSMLEVYNEKIRDLLAENSSQAAKRLEVKQAAEGTQEVPGLVEAQAYNTGGVWELLRTGAKNRSVGSTNANELSSRSHSLVRITTKGKDLVNGMRTRSHLWLVDLAGSERVGKIEVEGERLKEAQFINKSLSALGDVIAALASKNPHIPYRNSKLTHLLQSSLGGDCKTLMFVQISPCSVDLGETLCSLNFATRVRGIEQGPARKHADPAETFKYKQMAEKLRQEEKEITKLNESLQLMHIKYASRENVFKNLQEKVRDLENQLSEEKKKAKLEQQEPKDSDRYHKPPLPPPVTRQRLPLARISGNFPAKARPRKSMVPLSAYGDKENVSLPKMADTKGLPPPVPPRKKGLVPAMKARRVLLAPMVMPAGAIQQQPRRRASIAVMPGSGQRSSTGGCRQASVLRIPRRRSVMPPILQLPSTPLAAASKAADIRAAAATPGSVASKFYSPPQNQQQLRQPPPHHHPWRSKIPVFGSPWRRLRFVSGSPGDQSRIHPPAAQLCFSVHKRLLVGSPATKAVAPPDAAANLRDNEITGRFAGRILSRNNRRRSVM